MSATVATITSILVALKFTLFSIVHVCARLSNGQHIQMLTALVLQLVQCTVVPPKHTSTQQEIEDKASTPPDGTKEEIDKMVR